MIGMRSIFRPTFAEWMAGDEYRDEYFASPEDLQLKLDAEFTELCCRTPARGTSEGGIRHLIQWSPFKVSARCSDSCEFSTSKKWLKADIKGRLVVFFPGQFERNNYRLLDARDGWNYLAVPITLHGEGGIT